MNTVKDLIENEELAQFITEDLEDFDETSEVIYEVWAIGYDRDDNITDAAIYLGSSKCPDEAINRAKNITLDDVLKSSDTVSLTGVAYYSIEVETVVLLEDEDDSVNAGTIWKDELVVKSWDVCLKESDYELVEEDGSIKVKCELLKDFNKNDRVTIKFVDEPESSFFTYRIISKTTDNFYILEFEY